MWSERIYKIKPSFPHVHPSIVLLVLLSLSNALIMTKTSILTAAAAFTALASAAPPRGGPGGHNKPGRPPGYGGPGPVSEKWNLKKFTSLVAFGDSYTDDSRLGYFGSNNGSAPPVGWVDPAVSLMRCASRTLDC
jgi:hypothetical protein